MNQDIFAGQWKQMRGELKSWWGKLADDDFDRIGGQKDKLIGVVQEKYGYAREQAQQEVERRLKEYGDTMGGPSSSGRRDASGGGCRWAGRCAERRPHRHGGQRSGWVESAQAHRHRVGIGARCHRHGGDRRGGWSGIGELVSSREKIRRDGHRPHRLGTHLPCPIVIGWGGPWLYPGPTHYAPCAQASVEEIVEHAK